MKGPNFRYVPNTADVAFIAYGSSLRETLQNSATAMLNVMFDIKKVKNEKGKIKTIRITEKASTNEELIWFTLQKILSKIDEKGVSAFKFKVNRLSEINGKKILHGCVFYKNTKKYLALLDVKAVTPHELKVTHTSKRWAVKVIVDV